jgi:hypothetical protein
LGLSETAGGPVLNGQMIVAADEKVIFQTENFEHLRKILAGEPGNYTHR